MVRDFFNKIPFFSFFLHSFYIVVSYLGGEHCAWAQPCRPFAEIRSDSKERFIFLAINFFASGNDLTKRESQRISSKDNLFFLL